MKPAPSTEEFAAQLIPPDRSRVSLSFDGRNLGLTNLRKVFWPDDGFTKGDLLRYYLALAPVVLPHVRDRAMAMKRYPEGIAGPHFFMKRAPDDRPEWIALCDGLRSPMIQDIPSLLWVSNLGCIDLNPSFGRCDALASPDYLHFDLDPTPPAPFARIREVALLLKDDLDALGMPSYAKSTGARGMHVYVPIVRGPTQEEVWAVAKALARSLERRYPHLVTARYVVRKRPAGRVHVDYNQNAWGRTLASVYSVRPRPGAPVSAPVTWEEVARGFGPADFRLDNMAARVRQAGDLWGPVDAPDGRFDLLTVLRGLTT